MTPEKRIRRNEGKLAKVLARAMDASVRRMEKITKELLEGMGRDAKSAAELLDGFVVGSLGTMEAQLREAVRLGLPPTVAKKILQNIRSRSQGMTVRQAYRRRLMIERELLKAQMRTAAATPIGKAAGEVTERKTFELQKKLGVGWSVNDYPKEMAEALVQNPHRSQWILLAKKQDGSEEVPGNGMLRLDDDGILRPVPPEFREASVDLSAVSKWIDDVSDSTARNVYDVAMEGVLQGKSPYSIGNDLEKVRDTVPWRCRAMARTMFTETAAQADTKVFRDAGVERYSYMAGLDERTCPVCGKLDLRVFRVDKAVAGRNYPPMHPNCRCTVDAVLPDDRTRMYKGIEVRDGDGERASYVTEETVDKEGNIAERRVYTRVPANMTYREWRERYVRLNRDTAYTLTDEEKAVVKSPNGNVGPVYRKHMDFIKKDVRPTEPAEVPQAYRLRLSMSEAENRNRDEGDRIGRMLEEDSAEWLESLTAKEKEAIKDYTGSGYGNLNKALYDTDDLDADEKRDLLGDLGEYKALDDAIERYELKEGLTVNRNVWSSPFRDPGLGEPLPIDEYLVGKDFPFESYTSTTVGPSRSNFGDIYLHIYVPPGKGRGMYVEPLTSVKGEKEFLLKRGAKYHVKSVKTVSDESGHKYTHVHLLML